MKKMHILLMSFALISLLILGCGKATNPVEVPLSGDSEVSGLAKASPQVDTFPISSALTNPGIAPIGSSPHGKTYSEWPADWWDWALGSPASEHPVLDETGVNCGVNQSGNVWFLAGRLFGSGPIVRQCTVPEGQALFFPLINQFFGAFPDDPPGKRKEKFLRRQVDCVKDAEFPLVEIDGVAVNNPEQYLEESVLFDLFLPEESLFGELTLSPSVDKGFYLFLFPLPPGDHTIKWQASSADCGSSQNITYNLTVE